MSTTTLQATWNEAATRFMRLAIRAGGKRTIGPSSKCPLLAQALCRAGMLRLEHYVPRHRIAIYAVTEQGHQEFGQ